MPSGSPKPLLRPSTRPTRPSPPVPRISLVDDRAELTDRLQQQEEEESEGCSDEGGD